MTLSTARRARGADATTAPATGERRGEVVVSDIGLDYNGVPALADTDLHVHAGEFFTLLGPSGSGKTTLLRIIAGLLDPARGTLHIDGTDVTRTPTQKRDIGFVFQNYALFPHLTVAENIEYGLKVRKLPAAKRAKRVAEMVDLVALGGFADRYPAQLSGGQQQRVALGRALAQNPRVLLLDEPLGALDRGLREELGAEVRRIQQESNTTAVYVTHDQEEAFILSDRMGVMRDGRICQLGTPEQLYREPKDLFVAKFLGKTNLFPGHLVGGDGATATVRVGDHDLVARANPAITGDDVVCSVRPEQLVLGAAGSGAAVPAGLSRLAGAVVTEVRFLGQRRSIHLDASGIACSVDLDPALPAPAVGDHVSLLVRPGEVALVAAE
ncbi:iron(III) transport system ATP-binding protein/putative spermidine/putrescine transport system ATP-binding protein/thiamine transport system ATP-binding protein [Agromyces sp. CF514]|uniref:ABC transporter ATP-binding protein n=1 Tax=Agromyces sp. CF514 TaxID=1881031 RepID=UPI0008E7EC7D|nr:ABC transporter ATP-binding protein [Agromyces sp. CF514]SFR83621.1 iron(III) transport system ATP-binding protein/putative spermidine/putrescine transport system ATP-binding protein/thiamine transport system ATP-binding protein [Agromyces sp. CF514]